MSKADQIDSEFASESPMKRSTQSHRAVVVWCVAASLLLIGSGVVRAVQSKRYDEDKNTLVECPFPLNSIPKVIDTWEMLNGSETILDPLTTRITGSTDHTIRTYRDDNTGVQLSVLILFGPAEPVLPHTPQICYPSSGFRTDGPTIDHRIKYDGDREAEFRSSIFAKSGGRIVLRQAVYHSYYLDGLWSPAIFASRKIPRKNPGIFKVQIQRRIVDGESLGEDEPIEGFIKKLLPTLEKMIQTANKPASNVVSAK